MDCPGIEAVLLLLLAVACGNSNDFQLFPVDVAVFVVCFQLHLSKVQYFACMVACPQIFTACSRYIDYMTTGYCRVPCAGYLSVSQLKCHVELSVRCY